MTVIYHVSVWHINFEADLRQDYTYLASLSKVHTITLVIKTEGEGLFPQLNCVAIAEK